MSQQKEPKLPFHVSLSKQVAEQFRRGTNSLLLPHDNAGKSLPYNPITGKTYTAINNVLLSSKGYKDNRWLSFDEAAKEGYQVKKGEKSTEIVFYSFYDPKTKEAYEQPKVRTVKLFNAEQLIGIEQMPDKQPNKEEVLEKVQSIFENSQVKIVNNQKDKVFYRQKDDTIYMPPKEAYKDELAYSSAAIHELCRWAGTGEERLNFPAAPFGTEAFAREKLRTEIATYMLTKELGIPFEPQGQQFAEQWTKIIEKHPFEILNAAKDAEKIKGFVMEFDKTLENQIELEQNKPEQEQQVQQNEIEQADSLKFNNLKELSRYCFNKGIFLVDIESFIIDIETDIFDIIQEKDFGGSHSSFKDKESALEYIANKRQVSKAAQNAQDAGATYVLEAENNNVAFLQGNTIEELLNSIAENSQAKALLGLEQQEQQVQQEAAIQTEPERDKQPKKEMVKLSVSYDDKDEAKKLGAKWDKTEKTWYVEKDADLQPFYKWLPKKVKKDLIIASRDYLNVPMEEKDEAKALGAKWDKWQKAWYVEKGTDLEPFAKWGKLDLKERQQKQEKTAEQIQKPAEQIQSAEQEQKAEQNIAETKTYIAVSWDDKDEAKKLGAKWDGQNKSWYVEKGQDLTPFTEWLIDENTIIPTKQETVAPEIEFAQHLREWGLDVDNPIMDGQIHRVPLIGKPGGKDGAYCGYLDGVPNGWAQNYVTGEKSKFVSSGIQLTDEEKARQRAEFAQRQQEREERRKVEHDNAAQKAAQIYRNAAEVKANNLYDEDSYLGRKGVSPFVAKQNSYGQLVVPMQNIEGEIRGIQFINKDGSKQFLPGIEKKGCFAVLNSENKDVSNILVCEGFATGASLHEATKLPVAVAFDAGNLEPVAKAIHEKFQCQITICADNDQHKENNVGLEYARKAAQAVNGKLAVPMFTAEEKAQKLTDFNDLHKSQGLEAVKRQVSQAKSLVQNKQQSKVNGLSR